MRIQAEQAKQDFKAQGLEIFKDAMITMSSKDPFPIAVQLTEKQLYQILFIGSTSATKLYFELFDGKDQKIAEKTIDDPSRNNFMIYSFIPSKSDVYLIILSQKTKGKKEVCGSLTIMQKANVKQENTPD